ncbi:hypothetical protein VNO77_23883 [Canavalia gladiata]|uniref:Uncharacterized protein n=1 Tax=Canavalia gladiata TaxID=3824 RepID=A0AAN9LAI3_CANGL
MRIAELILVLCLLLWACIGSNTVARKTNLFDGAKKKKKKNTSLALHDARKCNPKRHLSCYDYNTTSSDDKRVVPTGPNPLHNRQTVLIRRVRLRHIHKSHFAFVSVSLFVSPQKLLFDINHGAFPFLFTVPFSRCISRVWSSNQAVRGEEDPPKQNFSNPKWGF